MVFARKFERIKKAFARDEANVESALVLMPLLILFLMGAQIIVATNMRNLDMAMAQGDAASRAISKEFQPTDQILEVGGRIEKIQILVTHRTSVLPQLVPGLAALLGGQPVTDVVGASVIEP
jgi:hypothetical protein